MSHICMPEKNVLGVQIESILDKIKQPCWTATIASCLVLLE